MNTNLNDIELLNLINKHSKLKPHFVRLLCVAEATQDMRGNADDIEIMVRDEVRKIGRQTINDWAISYEEQMMALAATDKNLKKHGKKNSIGTQLLE